MKGTVPSVDLSVGRYSNPHTAGCMGKEESDGLEVFQNPNADQRAWLAFPRPRRSLKSLTGTRLLVP